MWKIELYRESSLPSKNLKNKIMATLEDVIRVTGLATLSFLVTNLFQGRKVRSGYLPFRKNASTLPITPKRSSSRDVGTSSYRYHTATYSPASVSAQRRTNDTIFVASIIPGAIFQQDNACPHDAKAVRNFCSAQHMQLFPWPAYSPDMSPIEHVWDLVGRRLARDPRPAASKDKLLLCIQAIWNSLPQVDIQNLFESMPSRVAALNAVRGGYTKY
ncbi:hypothetical protein TNCV_67961 [Trichonephila clavipes]|nr:hypothetical protein TNCV_67961 [Trichonephila clavipes]